MGIQHLTLMFTGMLLLALLIRPISARLHLPFSAALIIAGFAGSELLVGFGIDTGLRWHHFHDLVLYLFLPVLIFESAFSLNARLLWRNIIPVLFLAIPVMLLSAGITAVLVYFGIGHPTGFPWIAALLTGVLLSATDPVAVVELFKNMGAPERLTVLVDGESLLNDAGAIVVFGVVLSLAMSGNDMLHWSDPVIDFLRVFVGGVLVGGVVGMVVWIAIRYTSSGVQSGAATLIAAYSAFTIADAWLHVSGVMAVLVVGLLTGEAARRTAGTRNSVFLGEFWELIAFLANAMIFLLVGATVTMDMFTERWLAILIGIAAVIIARAIGIFTLVPVISRLPGVEPIDRPSQNILFWGGLRGAVVLALALAVPVELDYWWTIQAIAYGVVLFTLFVQAPTMPLLLNRSVD